MLKKSGTFLLVCTMFVLGGCLADHTVLVKEATRVATYEGLKRSGATEHDAVVVLDAAKLGQDLLVEGDVDLVAIKTHVIAEISRNIDDVEMRNKVLRYADSIANYVSQYLSENPIFLADGITSREHDIKVVVMAALEGAEQGASDYLLDEFNVIVVSIR